MPTWSEWKSLNSKGEIQSPLPSILFQYRYAIIEQIFFDASDLDAAQKSINGRWKLRIYQPGDIVAFEHEVRQRFDIQYLLIDFLGNVLLSFFSWQAPINAGSIIQSLPSPLETVGANEGFYFPGGGADYTDNVGWILSSYASGDSGYWHSPIYKIALQPGARFHVLFHNIGLPLVRNRLLAIQTRTASSGTFGSMVDVAGFLRVADPIDGGRLWQKEFHGASACKRPILSAAGSPSIFKDATNKLFVAAMVRSVYRLFESEDDGFTWTGGGTVIWEDGYTNPHTAMAMDGLIVSVANKGGILYFRSSADGFANTVQVAPTSDPHHVVAGRLRNELFIVSAGSRGKVFRSLNGGASWQEVEATILP